MVCTLQQLFVMGVQFTLRLVRTFSFTGGFPFLAIAVTIPIGILLLMGIVVRVCCICVCNKDGIHTSDFLSKRDCDCNKCFKSNENFCRCLGGLLLWILLLPISLPYSIISSFWNGVWGAEEGDRMYCNPFPCCWGLTSNFLVDWICIHYMTLVRVVCTLP